MRKELLWPELPYDQWTDTRNTLQLWLQIVGKIRLAKTRWLNHSWNTTLYLTSRGLTTSVIHDLTDIGRSFSIDVDFIEHRLIVSSSGGGTSSLELKSESVASFHRRFFASLEALGLAPRISEKPNEIPDPIPFSVDESHHGYDPDFANRFWRILLQSDRVMKFFRSGFVGKASPVQYFWGSVDLAASRFSGRRAPDHPGGVPNLPDLVTREAYSHEVSSCGFWPGGHVLPQPAFYSYVYPEPKGFKNGRVQPKEAFYHDGLHEFILPYEAIRTSDCPEQRLLDFFQSTYEAAANLGKWDRANLEEDPYLQQLQEKQAPSSDHCRSA